MCGGYGIAESMTIQRDTISSAPEPCCSRCPIPVSELKVLVHAMQRQATGQHGRMRRRRSISRDPHFCHQHQPAATNPHLSRDQALARNKQGMCGVDGCKLRVDRRGRVREITGTNVDDVLKAHQEVRGHLEGRRQGPWLSGSFYLAALIIMTGATVAASRLAPPWTLPLVIVGSLLGVGTVGALQLRHDDRLSERRFVDLIKLTFLNLPALLRRSPPAAPPAPGPPSQVDPSQQDAPPA